MRNPLGELAWPCKQALSEVVVGEARKCSLLNDPSRIRCFMRLLESRESSPRTGAPGFYSCFDVAYPFCNSTIK